MAVAVTCSGQQIAGMGPSAMAEKNKSVTRLLQHSILQLCNEHIGYSHKLQILGVLCMTVDDEQQELVVKVNNTLKRVNPATPSNKDIAPAPPSISPVPHDLQPYSSPAAGTSAEHSINIDGDGAVQCESPPALTRAPTRTSGRRSHGRKGTNPVKVHHVYDEGEMIPEQDSEITTVIPTDPEAEADVEEDEEEEEDADLDSLVLSPAASASASASPGPITSTPISLACLHSRGSPSQRMLSGGELKLSGSAKRKTQYRDSPQTVSSSKESEDATSDVSADPANTTTAPPVSVVPSSAVRALLMSTGTVNGPVISAQSMATISLSGVPVTPICVAPEPDTPESMLANIANGDYALETSTDDSGMESHKSASENRMYVEMNANVIRVKEEPEDDYEYQTSTMDTSEDYSGPCLLPAIAADSLPSQVPYSGLVLPAGATVSQLSDGLSIRYTSTGPITVNANGKDASAGSKVKDIILYDDRAPLHMQKGNRIETTDFMVDKLGLEGRKRRRRGPEDTLTSEEIAEYMGSANAANGIFKCSSCVQEMNSVTSYLQHTVTAHSAYICHQCGKNFTTKSSLLRHRPIHTGMRRFACSICKKTFYRKDKCKAHIKRHLGANTDASTLDQYQQIDPIE